MRVSGFFVAAAIGMLAMSGAEAMPVASAPSSVGAAPLILARGGCGFGEHQGFYGGCRLNRGPRGVIRRLTTGAPRGCPPHRRRIRGICRFVY